MPVTVAVGQRLPWASAPLPEGPRMEIHEGGHLAFYIVFDQPTPGEVRNWREGQIRFGLLEAGKHTLFVLVKVGDADWIDMPFSAGLAENAGQLNPRDGDLVHAVMIYLIEAGTNIVRALRMVGPPILWCNALDAALATQRAHASSCTRQAYLAEIDAAYRRYPTSADMIGAGRVWVAPKPTRG